jgi:hypothetical protein
VQRARPHAAGRLRRRAAIAPPAPNPITKTTPAMSPQGAPPDECVGAVAVRPRAESATEVDDDLVTSDAIDAPGFPSAGRALVAVVAVDAPAGRVVGPVVGGPLSLATDVGTCCAPTVAAGPVVAVDRAVVATVLRGAVVGGGAGTHTADAVAGPRGAGSVGSPEPSGW